MNCFKIGFTLAEVLITLLIIGVVASLVIPSLINDTQRQEDYSKLLKAVSVIQTAGNLIRIENGGRMANVVNNSIDLANLFAEKMHYIKRCDSTASSPNCYMSNLENMYTLNGGLLGNYTPYPYQGHSKIVTGDGIVYIFQVLSASCQDAHYSENGQPRTCGVVFADINGAKTPNTWGKDIFVIFINDYNVVISGNSHGNSPTSQCDITKTTDTWNGVTCAGRAILEGGIKYY
jgi:prepilin-type N-terminal cleavage/methylation domain-containing protein